VWLARHRLLARPAAVKLIRPETLGLASGPVAQSAFRRFEREAQATASLRSPHTVALYDYGVARDGTFYYVMESLEGHDLDTLVRRFGALDPARAVYLLLQACDSLAEAHRLGLIHRDVKPANLFVCRQGVRCDFVKVLDFGLVKSTLQDAAPLTVADSIPGTPAFLAPEVALGGAVDARADVYGLGCVAYWMVTARMVFEGATPMELALKHVQAPPPPPSQRSGLPLSRGLEQLILRCLEKDRERRPAGMEALAGELLACDVGAPWSAERARQWWEAQLPEVLESQHDQA
jgi:serine/threonine-protein kinase